jgi:predicted DNA-binding transcriptional regulator AlpA
MPQIFSFLEKPLHRPGLYRIVNVNDGKCYVGFTQDVLGRMGSHVGPAKLREKGKLYAAIRAHGIENFRFEALAYSVSRTLSADDVSYWCEAEAKMIAALDSRANGYNTTDAATGFGPLGPEFSAIMKASHGTLEFRRRLSAILTKSWAETSPEFRWRRGIGLNAMTTEQRREAGRKGGQRVVELGVGIHARMPAETITRLAAPPVRKRTQTRRFDLKSSVAETANRPAPPVIDRPAPPRSLLRIQTLKQRFDLKSPITIAHWIRDAGFPQPLVINGIKFWDAGEVEAWIAARPRGAGAMPVEALRARGIRVEGHAAEEHPKKAVQPKRPRFARGA